MNYLLVRGIIHSKNHPPANQKRLPLRSIADSTRAAGNRFSRPEKPQPVGYHVRMYPMKQEILRFVGRQQWLLGRDRILRASLIPTIRNRMPSRAPSSDTPTRATSPTSST